MPRRRFQMPEVERRDGARPYWRVRYWSDVLVGKGHIERKRKSKFLGYCPTTNDSEERKRRGEMTKREAEKLRTEFMAKKVNCTTQVIQSQIPLKDFVEVWQAKHVAQLGAAAQKKYNTQLKNHILKDLGELQLGEIDSELIQDWLNRKQLSWATKTDLRGILSGIFHKAQDWGYWQDRNPVEATSAGKKRAKRRKKLLSEHDAAALLEEFPPFLVLLIDLLRTTGCRVSEVLGLEVEHIDFATSWVRIEQRWWRGDLDVVKTEKGNRRLPLGNLVGRLCEHLNGRGQGFLFDRGDGQPYDDRDLMRDYIRPRAKSLGIYFEGLGFHSFRREVNTLLQELGASPAEAQLIMGHSKPQMTSDYTVLQEARLTELVRRVQERRNPASKVVEMPKREAS